jgi:hypothetical protein
MGRCSVDVFDDSSISEARVRIGQVMVNESLSVIKYLV